MRYLFIISLFLFTSLSLFAQDLTAVNDFGPNPGNLKMYMHLPSNQAKLMPLVVVLHGCSQNAGMVAKQTGWNQLADKYGFAVLYAQQKMSNNMGNCFCWYNPGDVDKGKGENASIAAMMDFMKQHYAIDSNRVFITGLSAGAAMAVSMMATHPESFKAGAIFAGAPFKAANKFITGMFAMEGWVLKNPQHWGDLVRAQNPNYKGPYPTMIVYQGKADVVVNKRNGYEIVKQWTNLQGIAATPSKRIKRFAGKKCIEKNVFQNSMQEDVVIYYKIRGLGHALLVDPGKCEMQGGKHKLYSADKNYYSTYWTAVDFGLITPYTINGTKIVKAYQQNLTFSVPSTKGEKYKWTFPSGCRIISKNGNMVNVNWGKASGAVNVTVLNNNKCKTVYQTLFVDVK